MSQIPMPILSKPQDINAEYTVNTALTLVPRCSPSEQPFGLLVLSCYTSKENRLLCQYHLPGENIKEDDRDKDHEQSPYKCHGIILNTPTPAPLLQVFQSLPY